MTPSVLGRSAVPRLAFGVGTNRVLALAVRPLRPLQIESGLVFGAVHDEAQHGRLPALGSVVAVHLDVEVWESPAAFIDFSHHGVRVWWTKPQLTCWWKILKIF